MRSSPGSLLVLWRAYIYHPALSTDLWSDSNPWRTGKQPLWHTGTRRAYGKCRGIRGIGWGQSMLCTKRQKYPFLPAINVQQRERFVKDLTPLVQYTVYWCSQLEHRAICKSATAAIYSCLCVYFLLDDNVETLLME